MLVELMEWNAVAARVETKVEWLVEKMVRYEAVVTAALLVVKRVVMTVAVMGY